MSFTTRPLRKTNRLRRDEDVSEFCIASASNCSCCCKKQNLLARRTSDETGKVEKNRSQTRRKRQVQTSQNASGWAIERSLMQPYGSDLVWALGMSIPGPSAIKLTLIAAGVGLGLLLLKIPLMEHHLYLQHAIKITVQPTYPTQGGKLKAKGYLFAVFISTFKLLEHKLLS